MAAAKSTSRLKCKLAKSERIHLKRLDEVASCGRRATAETKYVINYCVTFARSSFFPFSLIFFSSAAFCCSHHLFLSSSPPSLRSTSTGRLFAFLLISYSHKMFRSARSFPILCLHSHSVLVPTASTILLFTAIHRFCFPSKLTFCFILKLEGFNDE